MVTEQYPERLGSTVHELDVKHACGIVPKTRFSMIVPEVTNIMNDIFSDKPETAVLFGIEASDYVRISFISV